MNHSASASLEAVRETLIETLDLSETPEQLSWNTELFGALPEMDSLGVTALLAALEDRFDIVIDDDEFSGDLFETVGSLTTFVDDKVAAKRE